MTVHAVLKPFTFFSSALCCQSFPSSHTGDNILLKSSSVLKEFDITEKLFKTVIDNGSNMVKAGKLRSLLQSDETETISDEETEKLIEKELAEFMNVQIDLDEDEDDDTDKDEDEDDEEKAINVSLELKFEKFIDTALSYIKTFDKKSQKKSLRCFDHTLTLVHEDSLASCKGVSKLVKKIMIIASKSHINHAFIRFMNEKGLLNIDLDIFISHKKFQ